MAEWETVRIPKEMSSKISEFINDNKNKDRGYNSKSDFVVDAIRDKFEHLGQEKTVTIPYELYKKIIESDMWSEILYVDTYNSLKKSKKLPKNVKNFKDFAQYMETVLDMEAERMRGR